MLENKQIFFERLKNEALKIPIIYVRVRKKMRKTRTAIFFKSTIRVLIEPKRLALT